MRREQENLSRNVLPPGPGVIGRGKFPFRRTIETYEPEILPGRVELTEREESAPADVLSQTQNIVNIDVA